MEGLKRLLGLQSQPKQKRSVPSNSKLRVYPSGCIICHACEDLERRVVARLEKLASVGGRLGAPTELHSSFAELDACAHHGCDPCRIWRKLLLHACVSNERMKSLMESPHPIFMDLSDLSSKEGEARGTTARVMAEMLHGETVVAEFDLTDEQVLRQASNWSKGRPLSGRYKGPYLSLPSMITDNLSFRF